MPQIERIDPSKDPDLKDWYAKWKPKAENEKASAIKIYGKKLNYKWTADKNNNENKYTLKIDIDESANNDWIQSKLRIVVKYDNNEYDEKKGENKITEETIEITLKSKPEKVLVYRRFDANPLYGEYKAVLVKEFKYICAYCESIIGHIDYGDVEHFRPKGNVTDDSEHPGYYWLAYDESNFLLSCKKCNQAGGKLNSFPVEGKRVYSHEEDIGTEKPYLLNSFEDNYLDHLEFCPEDFELCKGPVKGKTTKGKKSVEVYNLNRDILKSKRNQQQADIINALTVKLMQVLASGQAIKLDDEISKIINEQEYPSACISAANAWREKIKKMI